MAQTASSFIIRRGFGRIPVVEGGGGSGGGGGMGGSVITHTEYKDKPFPIVKILKLGDETVNKEITIINIKDFDNI